MKFTVPVREFADAVKLASEAGRVQVVADVECLTLTGSGREFAVRVQVPAEVNTPGRCVLPERVATFLDRCEGDAASVDVGQSFTLSAGSDSCELSLDDGEVWPVPDCLTGESFTLPADCLRTAIDRSAFAASKSDDPTSGYAKRAVAWDLGPKGSSLVATNGKRLAIAELSVKTVSRATSLVPPKAMDLVRRLCNGGDVTITLRPNDAFFILTGGTVYTRLVEGKFIDWKSLLPGKGGTVVKLDTAAFAAKVALASLTADVEARRLECSVTGESIKLRAVGAAGQSAVTYTPLSISGQPVTAYFDPTLLADVTRLGETVTMTIPAPDRSALFRGERCQYLVVPLV